MASRITIGPRYFLDAPPNVRITRRAIDAGINFVDTADKYSEGVCETIVGE
jgi:aryl-alcohol dehydrogenase-like predicted oxidoreductase